MIDLPAKLAPLQHRASLGELDEVVDYGSGEVSAKRSGFVLMILLAGVIATAGVVADSTATVIGAMIIAPLATPVHGMALGLVTTRGRLFTTSLAWFCGGAVAVVLIGYALSFSVADPGSLQTNGEVVGRTSPQLVDLLAAIATGFAGALALCRRDLGAALPGVAIAISLVPPLAVVGVCLGQGLYTFALGAFLLFVSNVLALIAAGNVVYTVAGYRRRSGRDARGRRGHPYFLLGVLLALVAVPLAGNTYQIYLEGKAREGTEMWLSDVPGAQVDDVDWRGLGMQISITTPRGNRPGLPDLRDDLAEAGVPEFVDVDLVVTPGWQLEVP